MAIMRIRHLLADFFPQILINTSILLIPLQDPFEKIEIVAPDYGEAVQLVVECHGIYVPVSLGRGFSR
jgi:hypothetical protein